MPSTINPSSLYVVKERERRDSELMYEVISSDKELADKNEVSRN